MAILVNNPDPPVGKLFNYIKDPPGPQLINLPELPGVVPNEFTEDHAKFGHYTRWAYAVAYTYQTGLLQMPVARQAAPLTSPSAEHAPSGIVRRHAGCGQVTMSWVAERQVQAPILPSYVVSEANAGNLKLLEFAIVPEVPHLGGDGLTRKYAVRGTYVYALLRPILPAVDGAFMGWAAFDKQPPELNLLEPGRFRQVF